MMLVIANDPIAISLAPWRQLTLLSLKVFLRAISELLRQTLHIDFLFPRIDSVFLQEFGEVRDDSDMGEKKQNHQ
jgi:hypothetical protein